MKTLKIEANYDLWLPVPTSWPWEVYPDLDAWATRVGDAFVEVNSWDEQSRQWVIDACRALSLGTDENEWKHVAIDPEARWIYAVSVFWNEERDDVTLDDLAATDDETAIRAPERSEFPTPHLGEGLRSLRFVDAGEPKHEIVGILQFGFKADGFDIMVVASAYDLALHEEMMPLVDEFVRAISVVEV